mmetsp:Transcript_103836/g.293648  ORF Transcript_103836/g.293648 Transcript_103836/m.293648 type:complete len:223 (+) Transcript_103836:792-1460(+)
MAEVAAADVELPSSLHAGHVCALRLLSRRRALHLQRADRGAGAWRGNSHRLLLRGLQLLQHAREPLGPMAELPRAAAAPGGLRRPQRRRRRDHAAQGARPRAPQHVPHHAGRRPHLRHHSSAHRQPRPGGVHPRGHLRLVLLRRHRGDPGDERHQFFRDLDHRLRPRPPPRAEGRRPRGLQAAAFRMGRTPPPAVGARRANDRRRRWPSTEGLAQASSARSA